MGWWCVYAIILLLDTFSKQNISVIFAYILCKILFHIGYLLNFRDTIFRGVAPFCWQNVWFLLKAKSWRNLCRRDAIYGEGCRTLRRTQ